MFGKFADYKKFPFQGVLLELASYKHLFYGWFGCTGDLSRGGMVDGYLPVADQFKPFLPDMSVKDIEAKRSLFFPGGKKNQSGGIPAGQAGIDPEGFGNETVRYLDEYSGAVAGRIVGAGSPPVVHVEQDIKSAAYDVVRRLPLDMGHEADAAAVVFIPGMVKSPGFWKRF